MPPKPQRRWFQLTPDRFVAGVLAVEIFLLLSEWRCWFGFNEHKGWAVLIGLAVLASAIVFLLLWLVLSLSFRRRFQFNG